MMTGHSISLSLDSDGVHGHFNCHEPNDGWCHQTCTEDCPVWDENCMTNHARKNIEYCNPIEFVDNQGFWYESYLGSEFENEPRSGPIVFEWQGSEEWYGWRYA